MTSSSSPFTALADSVTVSYLRREYEMWRTSFDAQPALIQRFLEAQAQVIANAILQKLGSLRFALPDQVNLPHAAVLAGTSPWRTPSKNGTGQHLTPVPPDQREYKVGGFNFGTHRLDLGDKVRQRLGALEQSADPGVALGAGLLRYAVAQHMVYVRLPAGRSVSYIAADGEETPTLPDMRRPEVGSAITQATDAIVEEESGRIMHSDAGRGELQVPYVPYARRFYLPQWVAFDAEGQLLVKTLAEAEAQVGSMQRFVGVLHAAVGLAAYFVADDAYQQKRYGMLGQLINQGRALARYQTRQIIHTIQHRARAHELNRGLSLSLPYFDDQALQLKLYAFVVIPAGRIMFVPAFVVRAAREEACRVAQDTRLSPSTRTHLLAELTQLEQAFAEPARPPKAWQASPTLSIR